LDHPSSTAAHALGPLRLLTKGVARASGGHRHGTHSLLAVAVVAVVSSVLAAHYGVGAWLPTAACIGYLAHLCGDFLTPGGVPWLWPLERRYSLPLVTTGHRPELLVRFACWVAVYVLAINYAHGWPYVGAAWRMIA
jgi:inner membrane protein